MSEEPTSTPRPSRRRLWLGLGGLGVLLVGAYAAAVLALGDDLPRGTRVAGVAVGGMSRDAATAAVARTSQRSLIVRAAGATITMGGADVGLGVDAEASVANAVGGSRWSPASLWRHLSGGSDHEGVVAVDDAALAAYVTGLNERADPPVDGSVRLTRKGVRVTEPEAGTAIDLDVARAQLVTAYVGDGKADLPTTEVPPEIDADDVGQARAYGEQALSGPVTLRFGDAEVSLQPRQFARAIRFAAEDGALVPTLREKALDTQLEGLVSSDSAAAQDATVRLVKGKPRVVPAKPGVTYDDDQVDAAFLEIVTRAGDDRVLNVDATVAEPAVTTADAEALGITEQVSTFTTYFPYAEYRNINIGRAAELVNGTIIAPGETFSLNGTVGERTAENGFTDGFIISNGIFKEDLGGGVSQMATTTFNAAFFAGMTDVEHKPHSFYIDRYPVGREATVAWPTVDLKWRNDTPYGVLVHAHVTPSTPSSQGEATVSLYSTKYWDIDTTTGERYNFTEPATRTLDTEDCYPNTGYGGFDIDVVRYWRKAGSSAIERTETLHTTYTPSDTVICKPPGSLDEAGPQED